MKIGIISRAWFTEVKGGAERYIYEIAKELIYRGYIVTTISQNISDLPNRHIKISVGRIPLITSGISSLLFGIIAQLSNIEFILVNGYWAEFAPLLIKKPWVLIIHDVALFRSERVQRNKLKHLLRKVFLAKVVRRAKKIIVPSKLTYEDLRKFLGVEKEKLEIVPEGIDIYKFKRNRCTSDGVFRIVQIGRFDPNKGQNILIDAFKKIMKKHQNVELYLIGSILKMYIKYYNYLIKISSGYNNILFKTNIEDEELLNYLNQADLCVFPSLGEEGWGLVVAEAFACQVPVICSEIYFKTGIADESRALLAPTNPEGLAEKILWAMEHRDFMERLALNGYKYIQGLSWKKTTEMILKIMEKMIKSRAD
jgi:1,4-alpha-glucan branching enzyme